MGCAESREEAAYAPQADAPEDARGDRLVLAFLDGFEAAALGAGAGAGPRRFALPRSALHEYESAHALGSVEPERDCARELGLLAGALRREGFECALGDARAPAFEYEPRAFLRALAARGPAPRTTLRMWRAAHRRG